MIGFPLMYIGAMAESYEERICQNSKIVVLSLLYVISIVIPFIGFSVNKELMDALQFGIVQAVLLFLICIHQTELENWIPQTICKRARNLSSILFLTHTGMLLILGKGLHVWDTSILYVVTMLFAIFLLLMVEKTNNKVLKRLLMIK